MLFVEFPQCALLGLTMKPTRLLYTHRLHVILGPLGSLDCEHRPGGHPGGQAYGRDKRGTLAVGADGSLPLRYGGSYCRLR